MISLRFSTEERGFLRLLNCNQLLKNSGIAAPFPRLFSSCLDTYIRVINKMHLDFDLEPDKKKYQEKRRYFIWSCRAA